MSEEKKEEKKQEKDQKEKPTYPQFASGVFVKHVIFSEKGWYIWDSPSTSTYEESIEKLKLLIKQIEKTIIENEKKVKEKEKEETKKVAVETK